MYSVTTTWRITDVEIPDTEAKMSTTLVRTHRGQLNRLARITLPLHLDSNPGQCRYGTKSNAPCNSFHYHSQQGQSIMCHSAVFVWQGTIQRRNVRPFRLSSTWHSLILPRKASHLSRDACAGTPSPYGARSSPKKRSRPTMQCFIKTSNMHPQTQLRNAVKTLL